MAPRFRFAGWLALATALVFAFLGIVAAVLWTGADGSQRVAMRAVVQDRLSLLAALAVLVPFVLGGLLRWWMNAYPLAAARLVDEVSLLNAGDTGRRVGVGGGQPLRQLADAINMLADGQARARADLQARVEAADARLEEERRRLAAVMAQVPHAVLLCAADGRVWSCNERAAHLFERDAATPASAFSLIDRGRVMHALDTLGSAPPEGTPAPAARFVSACGDRLLRAHVAPVPDAQGEPAGFVLLLDDITRSLDWDGAHEKRLRQRMEGMRSSLANIRAAAETVEQYPDMDNEHRHRFTEVIRTEAQRLSARLVAAAADADAAMPMDDMPVGDLVHALQSSFERRLHITAARRDMDAGLWVRVDSYSLVEALTRLMGRVVGRCAIRSVVVEAAAVGEFARLAVCWTGDGLAPETLRQWVPLADMLADGRGLVLEDVLSQHGAEIWVPPDEGPGPQRLCVQLPAARPAVPASTS